MFEGKHIHFSPVDNKPLCSYSSKLCRQRRLNGYAFCIRHILEDKSAPFKRCTYVTRNNNQICQNAIKNDQDRQYCHSHMQVAGIIPKTERKIKQPPKDKDKEKAQQDTMTNNANTTIIVRNENNNETEKKDPNAVFKFEEETVEDDGIGWVPKGINGSINGGKVIYGSKGPKENGAQHVGVPPVGMANGNHVKPINGKLKEKDDDEKKPPRRNYSNNRKRGEPKPKGQLTDEDKKKDTSLIPVSNPPSSGSPKCAPENEKFFEQLKTLKAVEKSLLQANSRPTIPVSHLSPNQTRTLCNNNKPRGSGVVNLFSSLCSQQNKSLQQKGGTPKQKQESRQEFLARVREAFKSQYLIIKNAARGCDRNEKIWERALRTSLLTCVGVDSSYSAHLIENNNNDLRKYSQVSDLKISFGGGGSGKKPRQRKPPGTNAAGSKGKGKKKDNANMMKDESSSVLSPASSLGSGAGGKDTDGGPEPKGKSKAGKRNPGELDTNKTSQRKKKARKGDELILSPGTASESGGGSSHPMEIKSDDSHSMGTSFSLQNHTTHPEFNSDTDLTLKLQEAANAHHHLPYNGYNNNHHPHPLLHPHSGLATTAKMSNGGIGTHHLQHLLSQPSLNNPSKLRQNKTHNNNNNGHMSGVLNFVDSSDMGGADGGMGDADFDYPRSSQTDCKFSDDDLERGLEFPMDPETEHEASRLLEDSELTEDDLNELFPEATNKLARSELPDLGDFSSAFDANDIDYTLFANIFPYNRTTQSESISISNQY